MGKLLVQVTHGPESPTRASSKSRGVTEGDITGKGGKFAMPDRLVELTFEADRVLTY